MTRPMAAIPAPPAWFAWPPLMKAGVDVGPTGVALATPVPTIVPLLPTMPPVGEAMPDPVGTMLYEC